MLLVQMRDDLRIAATGESVTVSLELAAHFEVVVELTVLDTPDRAVLVGDGLVSSLHIDDRKPADAKGDPGLLIRASVVWTAMA
jgi:hypothetical protein